jgi:hypothetical protein
VISVEVGEAGWYLGGTYTLTERDPLTFAQHQKMMVNIMYSIPVLYVSCVIFRREIRRLYYYYSMRAEKHGIFCRIPF